MEKALRITLKNGHFENVSSSRSKIMRAIKSYDNRNTEMRFRLALVRKGIDGFKIRQRIYGTCPDFYFAAQKLAIFVDGCFWHGCAQCGHIPKTNVAFWTKKIDLNKQRDINNDQTLSVNGIRVVRIWEHEIASNLNNCIDICIRVKTFPMKNS